MHLSARLVAITCLAALAVPSSASADDLFKKNGWGNIAGDRKASRIGDVLTVVVYQNAEARNAAQNSAQRKRSADGQLNTDVKSQNGEISLNGDYLGRGEVRRSESFVTQISVTVEDVLPNGDLRIAGEQYMRVNGEKTKIAVRGQVRSSDITRDNHVVSTRIANAEINYDGEGFVSRNSNSGPLGWLFNVLGLSG